MEPIIDIKLYYSHYIVTVNGEFYASADDYAEALEEVENAKEDILAGRIAWKEK